MKILHLQNKRAGITPLLKLKYGYVPPNDKKIIPERGLYCKHILLKQA